MYTELQTTIPGLKCLWVHVTVGPGRVLPDACVDLIWQQGHGAFLAGPDTTAVLTDMAPGTVLVGARFAPGAGGPALGHPLHALQDERLQLSGFDPELNPEAAVRAIAMAARRMVGEAPPDATVMEAARRLADPRQRVDQLAAELGLSDRQLRRRCLAGAGHTPKVLQRILRFQRFLRAAPDDLAWAAADAGYADQAHLTHECRALSGLTPAALLALRVSAAGRTTGRAQAARSAAA